MKTKGFWAVWVIGGLIIVLLLLGATEAIFNGETIKESAIVVGKTYKPERRNKEGDITQVERYIVSVRVDGGKVYPVSVTEYKYYEYYRDEKVRLTRRYGHLTGITYLSSIEKTGLSD